MVLKPVQAAIYSRCVFWDLTRPSRWEKQDLPLTHNAVWKCQSCVLTLTETFNFGLSLFGRKINAKTHICKHFKVHISLQKKNRFSTCLQTALSFNPHISSKQISYYGFCAATFLALFHFVHVTFSLSIAQLYTLKVCQVFLSARGLNKHRHVFLAAALEWLNWLLFVLLIFHKDQTLT